MRTFARSYFILQKYEIIGKLNIINSDMNKNNIIISKLCTFFLLLASCAMLCAQTNEGNENYYSNHKKGIKPSVPIAFVDSAITSKSDNITVDLAGFMPDTGAVKDSAKGEFRLDRRTLDTEGYSLYSSSPWYNGWYGGWYSSFYDPWLYSWGYDPWLYHHCWGCGAYWGWGLHWGFGFSWGFEPYWSWGYPWYNDLYYYNAYYAGYYLGSHYGGYGHINNGGNGRYGFLNDSRGRGNSSGRTGSGIRSAATTTSTRGTVRRGGVDLNSGGRAPHGRVSGTGTVEGRVVSTGSRSASAASRTTTGRYARPSTVETGRNASADNRHLNTSRGSSVSRTGTSTRTSLGNSTRSSYRDNSLTSPSRSGSSSFRSSSRSSSSSFRSSGSSSRSSSSSFRSSGSSSFRSSGSSSRSGSGSFRSSGRR